ncbi:MAG: hypothetical protein V4857_15010 [Pseudomonadota bacterium]
MPSLPHVRAARHWRHFALTIGMFLLAGTGARANAPEAAAAAPAPLFAGVEGPLAPSIVPNPAAARWEQFDQGGPGRMAILLTDPDSAWLGLVHGLQTIGVPFRITRDVQEALKHRVVLVYPTISGRALTAPALRALARFPESGGTLIGVNVEGGGLNEVFGFSEAVPSRTRSKIVFEAGQPFTATLDDERERTIPFSNPASANPTGSLGYAGAAAPLARFDDGSAAITSRQIGGGRALAFGVDPGFMLLTGYNNREEGIARSYANGFEPALDVMLRLLRALYTGGEPDAVTLHTVPDGKALSVLITHDIDVGSALTHAIDYARYEAAAGIAATYFIQTKYLRDWNDAAFFNAAAAAPLRQLRALGMEIASHSVSHSLRFNRFALGTGLERYPEYRPFVRDADNTSGASVLGEMRVSRFLLEHFAPGENVVSFRPGHLRNPYSAPQAMEASGYLYSSSTTANNSLTHLPFRLNHDRNIGAQSGIYEFPVSIEDEAKPALAERLPQALALADKLSRYGGLFVVLIHTNVAGPKLAFEQRLVEALQPRAWFGTVRQFGRFWGARAQVSVDLVRDGEQRKIVLAAVQPGTKITLSLPPGVRLAAGTDAALGAVQQGRLASLTLPAGSTELRLERSDKI